MRRSARYAILSLVFASLLGCDDEPTIRIFPPPPREDMGAEEMGARIDMGEEPEMGQPSGCGAMLEGERCALNHASGVCALGRCQLVTCEFGWYDCDGRSQNGCERDITQPSACGACERQCRAEERCALGERSWVCASGTVCEAGTFDVDRGAANGCEWRLNTGAETGLLAEADALADGEADGSAWVATTFQDARRVGWSGLPSADGGPLTNAAGEPLLAAAPRQIAARGSRAAVAWGDRATLHSATADEVVTAGHFESMCGPVEGVAWLDDGSLALTVADTMMTVGQQELEASCPQPAGCAPDAPTFGPADYVRAFFPYADRAALAQPELMAAPGWSPGPGEVAQCQPCLLDQTSGALRREAACWGQGQCAASPAQGCEACDAEAISCPSFDPVRVLPLSDARAIVATARGVVALERVASGWRPRGRLESPFDPGVVSGARVLDAALHERADGSARIFLWHSGGFVRALDLRWLASGEATLRPAWADVGLEASTIDARPARVASWGPDRALVLDDRRAWIVGYSPRGASIHVINASELASLAALLTATLAEDGGLWLVGSRFNLLAAWRLVAE